MFIEEYLQDLRRARFSLPATAVYLRRAIGRVREHIVVNPGAVRSAWMLALGYFVLAFIGSAVMALAYERSLAYAFFTNTVLVMVPVFVLLTLHLDLLRDGSGCRLSALNVPIALTLLRVVMAPGIVLLTVRGHSTLAFSLFLLAALTDVADGWLARRSGQITRLGTLLDPIVDILFSIAIFTGLVWAGLIPAWVYLIALARYGMLLFGGAFLYVFVGPVRVQPTAFGRLTGVAMSALVALLMLLHSVRGPVAETLLPLTENALGALGLATVAQVIALGWYNVRVMTGQAGVPGRVVGDVRWGAR